MLAIPAAVEALWPNRSNRACTRPSPGSRRTAGLRLAASTAVGIRIEPDHRKLGGGVEKGSGVPGPAEGGVEHQPGVEPGARRATTSETMTGT